LTTVSCDPYNGMPNVDCETIAKAMPGEPILFVPEARVAAL